MWHSLTRGLRCARIWPPFHCNPRKYHMTALDTAAFSKSRKGLTGRDSVMRYHVDGYGHNSHCCWSVAFMVMMMWCAVVRRIYLVPTTNIAKGRGDGALRHYLLYLLVPLCAYLHPRPVKRYSSYCRNTKHPRPYWPHRVPSTFLRIQTRVLGGGGGCLLSADWSKPGKNCAPYFWYK